MKTLEEMRTIAAREKCPKSMCYCGHTGDGPNSDHADALASPGHGHCKKCNHCHKFSWNRFTDQWLKLIA